ncbi:ABC-type uncharacterized transport system, substrate-binding protein [Bradyrhizobium sp. Rc2d]|uniref:DUF1007 family protein n=1 Tax=Bradyrhizobium sp. Rc2d TaxID=1855321 RepID=UPI00088CDE80|nr:DUF1007 family protein [Bradyrhizobium sp. Rc2d]SDI56777.1 ABC-type uncharacterized transport system, substrate-binding protein [Bradyrhizobium sp. Rc2d]
MSMRRLFGFLLVAAMTLVAGAASAHPHVWITATSELLYAEDGSVTGLRHAWTFDDAFSANAMQGLGGKSKAAYTREELAPLAQTQVESLKDNAYFTFLRVGERLPFAEPVDYFFDYKDDHLTLHFTLPLKTPVKAKTVRLTIFDRSFFIDFRLAKEHPVKLVGAPAGCEVWLRRSAGDDRDRKLVQDASEDTFKEGGANVAVGLLFIVPIEVECP